LLVILGLDRPEAFDVGVIEGPARIRKISLSLQFIRFGIIGRSAPLGSQLGNGFFELWPED
jgi:hypothetical protein